MRGRSPFGTVALLGDFPYSNPATRGRRPLNVDDPTLKSKRGPRPETPNPGNRELIVDSIGVGTSPIVVVGRSTYPRSITLRARAISVTISTDANVVAGGGRVIDPGEETQPFTLPPNTALYGVAPSAGAFLARTIRG